MSGNYDPATMARAKQFARSTEQTATPTNIYTVSNETDKKVMKNVNFPVKMGTSDLDDRKYALMASMVDEKTGVVPGAGQHIIGDEYFDYVTRKMDVAQQVMFKDWLMKQVDWSRPESAEYWVNMFPWMLEERLQEVNRVCELQKKKAKIEIAGPSSVEDWEFIFNEQRGLITVPKVPVHLLPQAYGQQKGYNEDENYKRGMFSPMTQYMPPFNGGTTMYEPAYQPVNTLNWSNPTGVGEGPKGTPLKPPFTWPGYVTKAGVQPK